MVHFAKSAAGEGLVPPLVVTKHLSLTSGVSNHHTLPSANSFPSSAPAQAWLSLILHPASSLPTLCRGLGYLQIEGTQQKMLSLTPVPPSPQSCPLSSAPTLPSLSGCPNTLTLVVSLVAPSSPLLSSPCSSSASCCPWGFPLAQIRSNSSIYLFPISPPGSETAARLQPGFRGHWEPRASTSLL